MTCADCSGGDEHCHELLLVHADGTQECLHGDCRLEAAAHGWRLVCTEVVDCRCAA